MGNTIWTEVRGRPVNDTASDSSTMYLLIDKLDALADKLGVRKLSEFCDYSALEEAYGDFDGTNEPDDAEDPDDAGEIDEPSLEQRQAKGEWFDSVIGLQSVKTLRQHLTDHFDALGFIPDATTDHWPEQLMGELAHTESVLLDAVARRQQFRLLIVP